MLRVEDIHTYYGDSYVLHGLSLEVPRGQLVALMGRNGVGKSTVIRAIAGLTPPQRGRITFDGVDVTRLPPYRIARRGLALVPQGRRIFSSLTVAEHLEKVMRPYGRKETWTIDRLLTFFPHLKTRWRKTAGNLSGGEQSMLAIARALRLEPRCLLLDEPMEGLSPVFVRSVAEIIQRLRQDSNLCVLLVVPELALALRLADRICVLGTGHVAFVGSPRELEQRQDIQSRYIGIGHDIKEES